MKACLICQTSQDQVSLTRIPVRVEGKPWGDVLVCSNCHELLGSGEIKNLIGIALREKSFEPANVILAEEGGEEPDTEEASAPRTRLELPISAAILREREAFSRFVAEKAGVKLWEAHKGGISEARWATSLTPDGEGGYIFSMEILGP